VNSIPGLIKELPEILSSYNTLVNASFLNHLAIFSSIHL